MGTDDILTGGPKSTPPATEGRPRGPLGSFPGGFFVGVVVAVAVTLLIVQNGESTQLDWLAFQFEAPLWIMLVLTLVAGGVITEVGKVVVSRSLAKAKERRPRSGPKPATRHSKA